MSLFHARTLVSSMQAMRLFVGSVGQMRRTMPWVFFPPPFVVALLLLSNQHHTPVGISLYAVLLSGWVGTWVSYHGLVLPNDNVRLIGALVTAGSAAFGFWLIG